MRLKEHCCQAFRSATLIHICRCLWISSQACFLNWHFPTAIDTPLIYRWASLKCTINESVPLQMAKWSGLKPSVSGADYMGYAPSIQLICPPLFPCPPVESMQIVHSCSFVFGWWQWQGKGLLPALCASLVLLGAEVASPFLTTWGSYCGILDL